MILIYVLGGIKSHTHTHRDIIFQGGLLYIQSQFICNYSGTLPYIPSALSGEGSGRILSSRGASIR